MSKTKHKGTQNQFHSQDNVSHTSCIFKDCLKHYFRGRMTEREMYLLSISQLPQIIAGLCMAEARSQEFQTRSPTWMRIELYIN